MNPNSFLFLPRTSSKTDRKGTSQCRWRTTLTSASPMRLLINTTPTIIKIIVRCAFRPGSTSPRIISVTPKVAKEANDFIRICSTGSCRKESMNCHTSVATTLTSRGNINKNVFTTFSQVCGRIRTNSLKTITEKLCKPSRLRSASDPRSLNPSC